MNFTRRAVSALAVASLLATGTVGAVAFNVSPNALPAATAQNMPALSGIPASANLNVHKIIGLETGVSSNGLQIADTSSLGLPAVGITYTAYRINQANGGALDLATQEGWAQAAAVDLDELFTVTADNPLQNFDTLNTDNARLGASTTAVTNATGTAAFSNLDTGLYLIMEENDPNSVSTPGGPSVPVAPSAPFLVTLPLTDPSENARNGWLDTVHVYPKGQQFTAPTKKILDPVATGSGIDLTGSSVGEMISYEASTLIPTISTGTLPGLSITDKLDAELGGGAVAKVTIGDQLLQVGTHYNVRSWTVESDGRQVLIARLTQTGLNVLGSGNKIVTVTYTATLNAVPTDGLNNTAWFRRVDPGVVAPDGWDPEAATGTIDNPSPGAATNGVSSTFAEIVLSKSGLDSVGNTVGLGGAEFELRRCYSEGEANAGELVDGSAPIRVGNATTWTSSDGLAEGTTPGTVAISGIHLSNTQPAAAGDTAVTTSIWADETATEYCLVETQAPGGYELLPAPYLLGNQLTGTETEFKTVNVNIENVRSNAGFSLPLTGGLGIWAVLGGGVLLLLLAAAYYMVTRNRKNA